ncbi:uncharacterized protein [Branchiostoma lanceolatum]|uniref:uncharacterized protein n=1 Tax=Branchiostoma lanceolatum TaxID=7740 RepID=UPI0034552F17
MIDTEDNRTGKTKAREHQAMTAAEHEDIGWVTRPAESGKPRKADRKKRMSWGKAVLMAMLLGLLLVCVESEDDTSGEVFYDIGWAVEGYNCYPPWHQHCQTSGSAILRRRTGSKLVRRRPLPVWEFDASAEDGLPLLGDLQEWLSDGAWTLPRETASDGSGSDHHAAKGIERRQLPNRHPGAKIRSQRPGSNEQR